MHINTIFLYTSLGLTYLRIIILTAFAYTHLKLCTTPSRVTWSTWHHQCIDYMQKPAAAGRLTWSWKSVM